LIADTADWSAVAAFLTDVESRYRKERLRSGPAAKTLDEVAEPEVLAAVERACELYLDAPPAQRTEMRAFFANAYSLSHRLWSVSGHAAEEAKRDRSAAALRLAFAALSLEDGHSDCRDTYLAINTLHGIAAGGGLDGAAIEAEVAGLSSPRMEKLLRTGSLDMGDFAS
jgi:hypothetical protein